MRGIRRERAAIARGFLSSFVGEAPVLPTEGPI